jgi:hypothetical protein
MGAALPLFQHEGPLMTQTKMKTEALRKCSASVVFTA